MKKFALIVVFMMVSFILVACDELVTTKDIDVIAYSYDGNVRVIYNIALDSNLITDKTFEEWLESVNGPEMIL